MKQAPRSTPPTERFLALAYAALMLAILLLSAAAFRSSAEPWHAPENLFRLGLLLLSGAGLGLHLNRCR